MIIRHYTHTLSGSAQQLTAAVTGITDLAEAIYLQPDPANTHVIYVGAFGASLPSASDYGIIIPLPPGNIPAPPIWIDGPIDLDTVGVLGTNNEKLHITVVTR